jgi:hypothetical protein
MTRPLSLAVPLIALAACGGGSSGSSSGGDSKPVQNPVAFPTSADAFETVTGDATPATASAIAVGEAQLRTLYPDGDVDWVKVTLAAGTRYEFSADRLSANCDVSLALYDADGTTQLASGDDYLSFDANVAFTPTAAGTYFLMVTSYHNALFGDGVGVARYTLGARVFVDGDLDGFSTRYDCDDADAAIFPWASETPADGIDQDCDGLDALDGSVEDGSEDDGTAAAARVMLGSLGDPMEIIYMGYVLRANARTIAPAGDRDWFSISVPAFTKIEIEPVYDTVGGVGGLSARLLDSDGTTQLATSSYPTSLTAYNETSAARTYYVEYSAAIASDTGFYAPTWTRYGTDLDRDGFFSQEWDTSRDCDDADASIHPGATETPGDGVDSNCNGLDDA